MRFLFVLLFLGLSLVDLAHGRPFLLRRKCRTRSASKSADTTSTSSTKSTKTSSSVQVASTSSSSNGGVSKLLIVSDGDEADAYSKSADEFSVSMNYAAETRLDDSLHKLIGVPFAPMLRIDEANTHFTSEVTVPLKAGAKYILGPNEPNEISSSSAESVAAVWKKRIEPLLDEFGNLKTVSPAVSSNPNFAEWFKDFRAACKGCHIDAWAVHIYGNEDRTVSESMVKLKEYIKEVKAAIPSGAKIWVTEFGNRAKSISEKKEYIVQAMKYFRSEPAIEVVGAFPHIESNNDFVDNGSLTELGKAWVNA